MNYPLLASQALAIAIGGMLTVLLAYFLFKGYIKTYIEIKREKSSDENLLTLRLQAHERVILFVERLNPTQFLVRIYQKGMEVSTLQSLVMQEINAEYQHNITQQLYINPKTWEIISKLKDDTIAMINNAVKNLPNNAPGIDLSKKILQHMSEENENPYTLTVLLIKNDIQKMFY